MRILIFSVSCKEIDDNEYCRCTIRRTYLRYQRFIGGSFQTGCENTTQDIFNLCFRAGFVIDGFYEECFKTNKEIPMVMIVRLKKVKRDTLQ